MKTASTPTAPNYWLDGSNSTYRAYRHGEPDEDVSCFVIQRWSHLEMEDQYCSSDKGYVCKITNGKIIILIE